MKVWQAHNYHELIRRWRAVARKAGLRLEPLAETGDHVIWLLRTAPPGDPRTIYLSTGIHGDEPAGPLALLAWAERHLATLRAQPFFILPCLNPWGLLNNSRFDARGHDLNRTFSNEKPPSPVAELNRLIANERFLVSLTLHEDYDADGLYIYEVMRFPPFWGERLLDRARRVIAIDSRRRIDRRHARGGLVRRLFRPERFPGMPESIHLHRRHSFKTFTVETPSEFDLKVRVAGHVAVLEEIVRLAQKTKLRGRHWTRGQALSRSDYDSRRS